MVARALLRHSSHEQPHPREIQEKGGKRKYRGQGAKSRNAKFYTRWVRLHWAGLGESTVIADPHIGIRLMLTLPDTTGRIPVEERCRYDDTVLWKERKRELSFTCR